MDSLETDHEHDLNQPTNLRMLMASVDFPLPVRKNQTQD